MQAPTLPVRNPFVVYECVFLVVWLAYVDQLLAVIALMKKSCNTMEILHECYELLNV